MRCINCGNEIAPGAQFCGKCGARIEINRNQEQKNNTLIIVIIAAASAVILAIIAALFIADPLGLFRGPRVEQVVVTPSPSPTAEPTIQPKVARYETYNRNYTYKRMSDIHSSLPASDAELLEMQNLITDFNTAWTSYINSGDSAVFRYLREGSEAYKNAVKYGSKNILESYEIMDVRDARKTGTDYYVWVYEVINEYSDKTERKEYHWVYRIARDNGGYYVADYTSDPAYK